MKISYVIPAYNEEAYIGRCLASLTQHIKNEPHDAEIIVVNTSTDRTKEIALSFPGVKVIEEPRRGTARARDTGYRASTGDLIANIDSDVIIPDGWSKKVLDYFTHDRELVAVSGPFIYYDLPKKVQAAVRVFYSFGYVVYVLNRFVLNVSSMIQGGNYVVRKKALDEIGGYNLDFTFYGDDADIARTLHRIGKVKFTFDLPMFSSGRRLSIEGTANMGVKYGLNYVWATFLKKPFSKTSVAHRPTPAPIIKKDNKKLPISTDLFPFLRKRPLKKKGRKTVHNSQ